MAQVDVAHPAHNPFDLPRSNRGHVPIFLTSFLIALLFNGVVFYFAGTSTFRPNYKAYTEEAVTAEIFRPPAPPPPPPPPPKVVRRRPPPLQPRPAAPAPLNVPPPATFNVPPVEHPAPPPAPPVIAAVKPPPPKPPPKPLISNPDWMQLPSADDMARFYPDRAQRMSVNGHATISCTVNVDGSVSDCRVMSQSPPDDGFGDAALKLSKLFKMRPQTRDGVPVAGAKVVIPIGFEVPTA
ncbi:MAG TPA: energy transducer TonB [Caulobacteraceae bacterium]|nr:energy transducer TonB [Caulobacteraceae bacterium]